MQSNETWHCLEADCFMPRATAAETADRVDALQMKLLAGEPHAECLTFARQQWGVSRLPGYRLLAWNIQTLIAAAGQAKEQGNPWCGGGVRQTTQLVGRDGGGLGVTAAGSRRSNCDGPRPYKRRLER